MFIIYILIILGLLVFTFIASFVLNNQEMFRTTFDISIHYAGLHHTWEGVEFLNIVGGSLLLGVLVVALATWGLDTRRKLKVRKMKKELHRLQDALDEAKAAQQNVPPVKHAEPTTTEDTEVEKYTDSSTATPEDITKSFEDTVEKGDIVRSQPSESEPAEDYNFRTSSQQSESSEKEASDAETFPTEVEEGTSVGEMTGDQETDVRGKDKEERTQDASGSEESQQETSVEAEVVESTPFAEVDSAERRKVEDEETRDTQTPEDDENASKNA